MNSQGTPPVRPLKHISHAADSRHMLICHSCRLILAALWLNLVIYISYPYHYGPALADKARPGTCVPGRVFSPVIPFVLRAIVAQAAVALGAVVAQWLAAQTAQPHGASVAQLAAH